MGSICAIIFDIDGVLKRGSTSIPGATDALKLLTNLKANVPFVFLTNSSGHRDETKLNQLTQLLGVQFEKHQMVQSHKVMEPFVKELGSRRVLLVGDPEISKEIAFEQGLTNFVTIQEFSKSHPYLYPPNINQVPFDYKSNETIEVILIWKAPTNWEESLQVLCDVIHQKGCIGETTREQDVSIRIFASNPDFVYQDQYPTPRFALNAFVVCLEALYEKMYNSQLDIQLFGKPFVNAYNYALSVLLEQAKRNGYTSLSTVYAIGDNPETDIQGANNAGEQFFSILTKTGCYKPSSNEPPQVKPHLIVEDVLQAVKFIIQKENLQ